MLWSAPWQLGTIQCDFNLPERFNLSYAGEDNKAHRPVMLHRAILGSLERFIGVYLEHTAGHFPAWLSPEQVRILNITDKQKDFGFALLQQLKASGVRATFDTRNEKLGFKVREAQLEKVPYMVVLGDKEVESQTLTLRSRKDGAQRSGISVQDFMSLLMKEIRERSLQSLVFPSDSEKVKETTH
jgi:threonyl-tRNA synthetase